MTDTIVSLIAALALYLILGIFILGVSRVLAGPAHPSADRSSIYAGGEAPPRTPAGPSYGTYFTVALFFAIVHLGVMVAGGHTPSPALAAYVAGLLITLVALWVA